MSGPRARCTVRRLLQTQADDAKHSPEDEAQDEDGEEDDREREEGGKEDVVAAVDLATVTRTVHDDEPALLGCALRVGSFARAVVVGEEAEGEVLVAREVGEAGRVEVGREGKVDVDRAFGLVREERWRRYRCRD